METQFRKVLALNIKVERVRKGLTQEALAELAGVSSKHITKIENSRVTPSVYMVYRIAKAMNVSVDKLLNPNDD